MLELTMRLRVRTPATAASSDPERCLAIRIQRASKPPNCPPRVIRRPLRPPPRRSVSLRSSRRRLLSPRRGADRSAARSGPARSGGGGGGGGGEDRRRAGSREDEHLIRTRAHEACVTSGAAVTVADAGLGFPHTLSDRPS
jgi:hypothetical protein